MEGWYTSCSMEGRITTPLTTSGVLKGKAKRKGSVKPDIAHHIALTCVYHIAFRTIYCSQSTQAMEKALPLGTGARDMDANSKERMIRADFIPALSWDWPIMPGKIMQGRSEGSGLLRMNPRPHALPTLLHCPDSSQHHNPPDHLTNRRRQVYQPQVPMLKQTSPKPRCTTAHSQKACCRNRSQSS
jgi:hypothetical protein